MIVLTVLIPLTDLRDVWPDAIALAVAVGGPETTRSEMMSAALARIVEYPKDASAVVTLRESEISGVRQTIVVLLDK